MSVVETGRVLKLQAMYNGCYIQLDYQGVQPRDDLFFLELANSNYVSFFRLAVLAAENSYELTIRIAGNEIIPTEFGIVGWMSVDWQSV